VVLIVVTVITLLALANTAIDTLWAVSKSDCPLGMELEQSGSQVLEHRPIPPKVVCKYEYDTGDNGAAIGPPQTVTYDSLPSWVAASALVIVSVLLWRLVLRADAEAERQPSRSN
jgi:hypothetical protein